MNQNELPKVGDGATYSVGSDRYPATVVAVKGNVVTTVDDKVYVVGGSVIDGSAEYKFVRDPDGVRNTFRFRNGKWESVYFNAQTGRWKKGGRANVGFGYRNKYYDPHF